MTTEESGVIAGSLFFFAEPKQMFYYIMQLSYNFFLKGIVSPDWKGLQMVSLDRFEV
jgi:hypothetical protein